MVLFFFSCFRCSIHCISSLKNLFWCSFIRKFNACCLSSAVGHLAFHAFSPAYVVNLKTYACTFKSLLSELYRVVSTVIAIWFMAAGTSLFISSWEFRAWGWSGHWFSSSSHFGPFLNSCSCRSSRGHIPRLGMSAGLSSPGTHLHCRGEDAFWISTTRFLMNVFILKGWVWIQLITMVESVQ